MSRDDDNLKEGPWKKQGPPDPEEILRKLKESFGGGGYMGALLIAALLIFFLSLSCFFTVQPGEVGVIQRFGRMDRIVTAGLNFKLPAGI